MNDYLQMHELYAQACDAFAEYVDEKIVPAIVVSEHEQIQVVVVQLRNKFQHFVSVMCKLYHTIDDYIRHRTGMLYLADHAFKVFRIKVFAAVREKLRKGIFERIAVERNDPETDVDVCTTIGPNQGNFSEPINYMNDIKDIIDVKEEELEQCCEPLDLRYIEVNIHFFWELPLLTFLLLYDVSIMVDCEVVLCRKEQNMAGGCGSNSNCRP